MTDEQLELWEDVDDYVDDCACCCCTSDCDSAYWEEDWEDTLA